MKILLVDPPEFHINPLISNVRLPSSGLMALNANLVRDEHEVLYLDCKNRKLFFDDLETIIADFEPRVMGVTGYTCDAYSAMSVCSVAKQVCPDVFTVFGGYHASATPELSLLTCPDIDACAIGEGEATFAQIVSTKGNGRVMVGEDLLHVAGLAVRDGNGKPVRTGARALVESLDSLAPLSLDNVEDECYNFPITTRTLKQRLGFGLSFSRGCRFNCKYCSNFGMWRQTWRSYSPERMIEEIRRLYDHHGKRNFFFCDNDFLMSEERLVRFVELLEASELEIEWSFETSTANIVKYARYIPRMRETGLYLCMIGYEFASRKRLEAMGKSMGSLEKSQEAARILRENKIINFALGIMGFPDDTEESARDYVEFFDSLQPDMVYTQCLTPLPGTRLFQEMHEQGRIATYDFNEYDLMTPTLVYDHADREEMARWHRDVSELLFTPLCLDLYGEYRRNNISVDELTNRYARLSDEMLEYNRGNVKFHQVRRAYQDVMVDRQPIAPVAEHDAHGLSPKKRRVFKDRMRLLDDRWRQLLGADLGPLDEDEERIILHQMTHKLPVDVLKPVLERKLDRESLINLWLEFVSQDHNKDEIRREIKARRRWKSMSKKFYAAQTKHLETCFPRKPAIA